MAEFKAWSWSALQQFMNCAYQYYRVKVRKDIKEAPSQQMSDGNDAHKKLENNIKFGSKLPADLEYAGRIIETLRNKPGELFAERELCINAEMKPVTFFAKDAWCRGKIDVGLDQIQKVWAGDWKTGKRKPDSEQMLLFAALTFEIYPKAEEVSTSFIWLPDKVWDTEKYERRQLPLIWRHFMPKVNRMKAAFEADKWPKNPSGLCRGWCPVKDCEHWEPKKHG